MLRDPREQLSGRFNEIAVPREVPSGEDGARILGERRRHVRTVRSKAQSRNQAPRLGWPILVAVLVLLGVLAARAGAQPRPERADPPIGDDDFGDAVPQVVAPHREAPSFDAPAPQSRLVPPIPVARVLAAAYRAAALDGDPAPSWRRRTRLAALVPWVSARDGREAFWRDVDAPTLEYTQIEELRATWHLDRLVFDPNEIRIEAMSVSRRRERRFLAAQVIHAYYQWIPLAAAADQSARSAMRADEVRAELDALTDGWFSRELSESRCKCAQGTR